MFLKNNLDYFLHAAGISKEPLYQKCKRQLGVGQKLPKTIDNNSHAALHRSVGLLCLRNAFICISPHILLILTDIFYLLGLFLADGVWVLAFGIIPALITP